MNTAGPRALQAISDLELLGFVRDDDATHPPPDRCSVIVVDKGYPVALLVHPDGETEGDPELVESKELSGVGAS